MPPWSAGPAPAAVIRDSPGRRCGSGGYGLGAGGADADGPGGGAGGGAGGGGADEGGPPSDGGGPADGWLGDPDGEALSGPVCHVVGAGHGGLAAAGRSMPLRPDGAAPVRSDQAGSGRPEPRGASGSLRAGGPPDGGGGAASGLASNRAGEGCGRSGGAGLPPPSSAGSDPGRCGPAGTVGRASGADDPNRPDSARGTSTEVGRVTSAMVPRWAAGRSSTFTPWRAARRDTTTKPIIRETVTSTSGGLASRSLTSAN